MITISEMKTLLEGVNGFANKVVYYEWPIGEAPSLPFVCYFSNTEDEFAADNINYFAVPNFAVELYSETRDFATEALFETAFKAKDLYYSKDAEYLPDERCWVTVFSI